MDKLLDYLKHSKMYLRDTPPVDRDKGVTYILDSVHLYPSASASWRMTRDILLYLSDLVEDDAAAITLMKAAHYIYSEHVG